MKFGHFMLYFGTWCLGALDLLVSYLLTFVLWETL